MSDKSVNIMLFLQRLIFAAAFLFLASGEALHLNAFVQNGIDIGLPYARVICTAVVALTFISAAGILLGLAFRPVCVVMFFVSLFSGFFFFAGGVNKVNVVGVLLALTILTGFLFTGAGKISLGYYLSQKKIRDAKRISFR